MGTEFGGQRVLACEHTQMTRTDITRTDMTRKDMTQTDMTRTDMTRTDDSDGNDSDGYDSDGYDSDSGKSGILFRIYIHTNIRTYNHGAHVHMCRGSATTTLWLTWHGRSDPPPPSPHTRPRTHPHSPVATPCQDIRIAAPTPPRPHSRARRGSAPPPAAARATRIPAAPLARRPPPDSPTPRHDAHARTRTQILL